MRHLLLVALALLGLAAPARPAQETVRIRVVYELQPADSERDLDPPPAQLFLATSADGWDPAGRSVTAAAQGGVVSGSVALPRDVVAAAGFAFKVTRGSWATVEVAADGRDIPNRTLTDGERRAVADGARDEIRVTVAGWADQRSWRWPEAAARASTVVGALHVHELASEALGNSRRVRVWLPPGYDAPANAQRCYPVLYMHDGQNCFDDATSNSGEWRVDETVVELAEAGVIEPIVVVGIDNAGAARSAEYNPPFTSFAGVANRGDAYVDFLVDEIMPFVEARYRVADAQEHTLLGGSSYGGNATLYAAMRWPDVFGGLLVESPAVVFPEGDFLARIGAQEAWPRRIFMAMGTREFGRADRDERLVEMVRDLESLLRERGLGDDRLRVVVEEGAVHHERAWAARLPEALTFLLAGPDAASRPE